MKYQLLLIICDNDIELTLQLTKIIMPYKVEHGLLNVLSRPWVGAMVCWTNS